MDAKKDGKITISPAWFDQCKIAVKRLPERAFLIKDHNNNNNDDDENDKLNDSNESDEENHLPAKRKRKQILDKNQLNYALKVFILFLFT